MSKNFFHYHWAEMRRFIYSQPNDRVAVNISRVPYQWGVGGWSVTTTPLYTKHFFKAENRGSNKLQSTVYHNYSSLRRYRKRYIYQLDKGRRTGIRTPWNELAENHSFTDVHSVQGFRYAVEQFIEDHVFPKNSKKTKAKINYGILKQILREYEKSVFNNATPENVVDDVPN